ncbi:MAG: hypothetical protein Q9213_008063 [Squamulea squamosa]
MPFPYQASATPVRTRKPLREREKDRDRDRERDRDARSTPSGSSKKHREASRSSNRSPLSSSSRPASLYTQTNVTLDQLPPLPRSETASPSSTRSSVFPTSTGPSYGSHSLSSSAHFTIPAALQQYLETDDDEEFEDAKTPQASSTAQVKPYFDAALVKGPSKPTSTQKPSEQSPTPLSRVNTRSSDPTPSLHHPKPHHIPVGSPTFTTAQPFFGPVTSEQYLPHSQTTPQYYPMPQITGHPMDMQGMPAQNFYQPYASPSQVQHPPFSPARNQLAREQSSASSRMSFSNDPFQAMGQMPMMPADMAVPTDNYNSSAIEGEDDAVLKRIQNAIPDLNLLLTRYRQTSGQLGEREVVLRQTEAEKTRVLEQKDVDIQRLTKDIHEALQKNTDENKRHGEEKDKLRLEIGNMTEKHHELQESLQAEKARRGEAEKALQTIRTEHTLLLSESQEEKRALTRDHEEWKAKALQESTAKDEEFQRKEKAYVDHQQRQAQELEGRLQAATAELKQKHAKDIAELTQKYTKDKDKSEMAWSLRNRELEDIHVRLRRDLNDAKDAHKKSLDDHVSRHGQEKDAWTREREALLKDWESERAKMGQGSKELISQHQKEIKELQQTWKSTEARLMAEVEDLTAGWKSDRESFKATAATMQSTVAQLNNENSKLQKLADALEQVTDLRGRGDAF